MKSKILNFLLLVTSLFGYLEWGANKHMFLFQIEGEVLSKLFTDPTSVLHPLIVMPVIGQIMLLVTLFQRKPNNILTYISIGGLGLLLGFICLVGLLSFNYKIILSTLPFIVVALISIRHYIKIKKVDQNN